MYTCNIELWMFQGDCLHLSLLIVLQATQLCNTSKWYWSDLTSNLDRSISHRDLQWQEGTSCLGIQRVSKCCFSRQEKNPILEKSILLSLSLTRFFLTFFSFASSFLIFCCVCLSGHLSFCLHVGFNNHVFDRQKNWTILFSAYLFPLTSVCLFFAFSLFVSLSVC